MWVRSSADFTVWGKWWSPKKKKGRTVAKREGEGESCIDKDISSKFSCEKSNACFFELSHKLDDLKEAVALTCQ